MNISYLDNEIILSVDFQILSISLYELFCYKKETIFSMSWKFYFAISE